MPLPTISARYYEQFANGNPSRYTMLQPHSVWDTHSTNTSRGLPRMETSSFMSHVPSPVMTSSSSPSSTASSTTESRRKFSMDNIIPFIYGAVIGALGCELGKQTWAYIEIRWRIRKDR